MARWALQLISFDLDDTLIDTEGTAPARLEAAVHALRQAGVRREAVAWDAALAYAMAADPVAEGRFAPLLRALDVPASSAEAQAARAAYEAAMAPLLHTFEGVEDVLATLRRSYRLAVTTNGPEALQRGKIEACGIDRLVDWVVISETVGARKPDPAIFEHLRDLAGLPLVEAAHIGDSLAMDVAGARAAGMVAIWRRPAWPAPAPEAPAEQDAPAAIIDDLRELLDLL